MAKKREAETHATGWERTGKDTFNVKHNDGSVFECKVDDPRKFNAFKGMKNKDSMMGGFAGVGEKKPLICGICKQQVSRATYKDSKWFCPKCLSNA